MLTDKEAKQLFEAIKDLVENKPIDFPQLGDSIQLDVVSTFDNDRFIIDIQRKGQINIKKCTYQTRYQRVVPLFRIDIEGPPHQNPDLEIIPCPHIHVYREGFGDKWAYPLDEYIDTEASDLGRVLFDFLKYNNIRNIPQIRYQGSDLFNGSSGET
ncbi:hypothetical protein BEP19_15055 [Ammoniphilus oxalaticus]|uniref:Lj965 prophage protein n=1 Tax=Ammoniphilus oxalaticus TaxID=66863 RepID=A0A419SCZ4_9BACL|nr:hypothetical protein [Ammoniphilus oxalaticus]RKD20999.1 hypothetical protein BEP19_15055 [Ammoniphilus oxalaticus]